MLFRRLRPVGSKIILKKQLFDLQSHIKAPHLELTNSGTSALALALIDIKSKSRRKHPNIIIPDYACPDLVSAAVYAEVMPIVVDNKANSHLYDPDKLASSIDKNTIAIIAVNFMGAAQDIDFLKLLSAKHSIKLIEDRAQFFPIQAESSMQTDYSIYSFGRGKPVNLLGGGALAAKDRLSTIAKKAISPLKEPRQLYIKASIYNLIITPFIYRVISAIPFLNIGKTQYHELCYIGAMPQKKREILSSNIKHYLKRERYTSTLLASQIAQIDGITPLYSNNQRELLRISFLTNTEEVRNNIYLALEKKGLGVSCLYPSPLHERDDVQQLLTAKFQPLNSQLLAKRLITIPSHENLTKKDASKIIKVITDIASKQSLKPPE